MRPSDTDILKAALKDPGGLLEPVRQFDPWRPGGAVEYAPCSRWPRDRIKAKSPGAIEVAILCGCHRLPISLSTANAGPGPRPRPGPTPIRVRSMIWRGRRGMHVWRVRVFLGQCPDCGRVYWDIVDA